MRARVTLSSMEIEESTPAPAAAPEAADAPVEQPIVEPAVETPVAGELGDLGDPEAIAPATEPAAEEAPDPYADFGGRSEVEAAHRLWQASQTDDGIVSIFLEAGRNLGLSPQQMQALFDGAPAEEPAEEVDLDEPLTRGEFLAEQQRREQAAQDAERQRTASAATKSIDETFKTLGVADEDRALILQLGEKHFDPKNVTPEAAAAAVRAGHAEYQALVERKAQEYLQSKKEKAQAVPSAPAGAGPAAEPPADEPVNVAEAIKRTRAQLFGR